jgi:natural product biosynthesis luciferase-like monooxygenase protein/amino acid adenylation domain-containing protein/FkbM family methyltransferase
MNDLSRTIAELTPEQRALLELRLRRKRAAAPAKALTIEPRADRSSFPLSFAQQRLWFLDQLEPGSPLYVVPSVLRIRGRLDVAALEGSFAAMIARHEALRASFVTLEGQAVQVVLPALDLPLPVVDLRGLVQEEREAEALRLARRDALQPFDLSRAPLLRSSLVRLADEEHLWLLSMHHIVSDGWSVGVLVRELVAAYQAFSAGQEPVLPELPLQYADFAAWQRERLSGETLEAELAYWRRRLDELPTLELPADRPRPAAQTFRGARFPFSFPAPLATSLAALGQAEGATSFMTLLAGFAAVLGAWSGQDDIAVGTPIANRNRLEIEGLIGFFVNTLVVRTDLGGDPTFRQLLRRVRDASVEDFNHQDVPFEKLVEELRPERALGHSPLFQILLAVQNAPRPALRIPGLAVEPLDIDNGTAKFDLGLFLEESGGEIVGAFEHSTDLFDPQRIERLAGHLRQLLEGAMADPDRRLSEIPLLTPAEREQIRAWNDTRAERRGPSCLHHLFERQARRTPDAVAAVLGDRSVTYAELEERANRLARHLRTLGARPDRPVGLCVERSPEMLVGLLGILKTGAPYVPLDASYPAERLAFMLREARIDALVAQEATGEELTPALPSGVPMVRLDADADALAACSGEPLEVTVGPDHLAYILFTSGSTGRPKGVALSHGVVTSLLEWQETVLPGAARTLQFAPLSFDVSCQEIFTTLGAGGTLLLVSDDVRRDPVALLRLLDEHGAERLFLPFVALQQLAASADEAGVPCAALRDVVTAGEQLQVSTAVRDFFAARPACRLHNQYGPTESHVVTSFVLDGPPDLWPALPPIGRPVANARVELLGAGLRQMPVGVPGELYIGGLVTARGYVGRPDLTAERFVPDPFGGPGARLYRTGDLARRRPDGEIEFLGRADDQVKVRGFRVEPGEIEAVLATHPAVREAVVAVREEQGDRRLAAWVVPAAGGAHPELAAGLRAFLRERLPEYMVPSAVAVLEALPLTPSGKVDRRRLPAPAREAEPEASPSLSASAVEELLASLWSELLDVERIAPVDSFFDLGGHSLLATRLAARVRRLFGVELPLRAIFEHPTLAALAREVERARGRSAPAPPVRPVPRDGEIPLSFAQERFWFLEQLEGAAGAYNLPSAVRFTGDLDRAALEASLRELVRRHEALRTVFPLATGRPVQAVLPPPEALPLPLVELGGLAPSRGREESERLAVAVAARPFDLARGPVLRSVLLRLEPQQHVLLLNLHHIAADGWSFGILLREIAELVPAFAAGRPPALPAPPVQYTDFAVWQREWLRGEVLESELAFWRGRLAGSPPVLELPFDRPRPAVQTFAGGTRFGSLGRDLSAALARLARREGSTLFMTLLALFDTLLLRHTGRADLVVGTPVAGRTRPELEGVVGCFINTLALRTDLSGDPEVREAMRRVREATLDAYDHQEVPFARVVAELLPQRDLSYSPVFQVQLSLQNAYALLRDLGGLELAPVGLEARTARFDLSLTVEEGNEGLSAALNYNADLFDATTVDRLLGHWRNLLTAAVEGADRRLSGLPLLGEAEAHQLLVEANDTAEELADPLSIHRLFELQAARTPDAEAVVFRGAGLSYAELDARANRLARRLRRYGVGPEVPVGVFLERTPDLPVALLGILKAGGCYLPLDPAYPAERLAFMLEDARVPVLVTGESLRGRLPATEAAVLSLDAASTRESLAAESPAALADGIEPGTLAYLIYTSGSTGRPKGVMVGHRNAVNFFAGMDRRLRPDADRPGTWLAVTSVSFDISVLELLWTLTRGFRVVLHADEARTVALSGSAVVSRAAARQLDFSLFYFANDEAESDPRKYRLLLEGARFADRHGFAAVWTPERHFHAFGGLYPNPAVVGAAVAAATERVKIRAGSVVLPLQDPLRVAEEWSVVDNLSGGRVGVSFASGWHADDFVLAPQSYRQRKDVMFRGIETVRRLWRGEAVERENGTGQTIQVRIRPRPLQPELPFWVTAGGSPETFRRAGEVGAGLLTHLLGQSLEDLAAKVAVYREAWRQAGHAGEGHVTLMLHTFVGDDLAEVRETVRKPFRNYLRTSVDLLSNLARGLRQQDLAQLPAEDVEILLDHGFERYFESSAFFGTPERCLRLTERLKEIGCDEIGCLIDFGVDPDRVLESLGKLDEVRRASEAATARASEPVETVPELLLLHSVTHLQGTPSLISMLAADTDGLAALGGLSHLLVGGEPFPVPQARKLRAGLTTEIHNMYGPTETTVWSATHRLDEVDGRVPVGRAIANTGLYVLDEQLLPLPGGATGELYIGGEGVTRGYLGRPEATAAGFAPDPFSGRPGARLYRTGDLARFLPDGTLEILGRRDSQVKVRGYRIELGEIESRLARHPAVRQAAVAVVGTAEDRRLAAYVVPHRGPRGKAIDPERARAVLGDRPGYTLPNGMLVASLSHMQTSQLYREIFREERYLQHGITLEDGDCVFDVGANIGFFTMWAGLSRRDVKLFSFEPIPPTFDYLRTNAALYDLGATLVNAGLSSRRESAEFTFYRALPGLSGRYAELEFDRSATRAIILESLREGAEGIDRSVFGEREIEEALDDQFRHETWVCELRTLSDVIAEHGVERIDLLKIDVERSEVDVLAGVRDEDWPKIRQIVIEVDGRGNRRTLESLLESKGYDVTVDTSIEVPAADGSPEVYIALLYAVRRGMARRPAEAGAAGELTAELRAFLQASLPEYMVPSAFVQLAALPLTPNGKVDRRALPAPGAAVRPAAAAYVPPESETERVLAEIWREALRLDRVGADDNFFEAGGNSLLMAQMLVRVREAFHRDLAIVELFRHPTVRSLARFLDGDDGGAGAALEKAADRGQKVSGSVRRNEALQRQRMFMESRRRPRPPAGATPAAPTEVDPE